MNCWSWAAESLGLERQGEEPRTAESASVQVTCLSGVERACEIHR